MSNNLNNPNQGSYESQMKLLVRIACFLRFFLIFESNLLKRSTIYLQKTEKNVLETRIWEIHEHIKIICNITLHFRFVDATEVNKWDIVVNTMKYIPW